MPISQPGYITIPLYLDNQRATFAAEVLRAIAHPVRLRLVAVLCEESRSVNELASLLELKQSVVSQQLGILRRQRLVAAARVGGRAIYRVIEPHLHEMVRCLDGCTLE